MPSLLGSLHPFVPMPWLAAPLCANALFTWLAAPLCANALFTWLAAPLCANAVFLTLSFLHAEFRSALERHHVAPLSRRVGSDALTVQQLPDPSSPSPSLVSERDRQAAFAAMAGSAQPARVAKHVALTEQWSTFLVASGKMPLLRAKGYNHLLYDSANARQLSLPETVHLLVSYVAYLRQASLPVDAHIQALQWSMRASALDVSSFSADAVHHARSNSLSTRLPSAALQRSQIKLSSETQAVTVPMLLSQRSRYFPGGSDLSTPQSFDAAAAFAVACLMLDTGIRVSNFVRQRSLAPSQRGAQLLMGIATQQEQHTALSASPLIVSPLDQPNLAAELQLAGVLQAGHVLFTVQSPGSSSQSQTFYASEWATRPPQFLNAQPTEVTIVLMTTKTSAHGGRPHRISRSATSSEANALLCSMLACIANAAHYSSPSDPFFSRRAVAPTQSHPRRTLMASDISALARELALTHDLPTHGFSAKSLKYGHVTSNILAGLSPSASAAVTGHRSIRSHQHYMAGLVTNQVGTLSVLESPETPTLQLADVAANSERFRPPTIGTSTQSPPTSLTTLSRPRRSPGGVSASPPSRRQENSPDAAPYAKPRTCPDCRVTSPAATRHLATCPRSASPPVPAAVTTSNKRRHTARTQDTESHR